MHSSTMTIPKKLLTATFLIKWIMTTKQCSPIAKLVPLIKLHQLANKIEEYKEEQEALYQEEKLRGREPEYFPKDKESSDNTDFMELLPEEYGYSNNKHRLKNTSTMDSMKPLAISRK